ncbi:MAG: PTS sugar transporter subunit IIA [Candidatus Zixiibacteriota bacterium]|nr:MAG: PTS sugar transporter subunit IIA [candidate division Zixibacteria bacterium]
MLLADRLTADQILLDVEVSDKWELIKIMSVAIMTSPKLEKEHLPSRKVIYQEVVKREKERSTGTQSGLAIPHARIKNLNGSGLCLARPKQPVIFDEREGRPASLVWLLIFPMEAPAFFIKMTNRILALHRDDDLRFLLLTATSKSDILDALQHARVSEEAPVTAREIMRPAELDIRVGTPMHEVTRQMLEHGLDSTGVMDENDVLVGEITCDRLFRYGMPHFFSQLKSVSFVREYDPFEKYFERETEFTAGDIMSTDFSVLHEDATLLEIVFTLSIKHRKRVFIVHPDGTRAGVIDRLVLMDRIINI